MWIVAVAWIYVVVLMAATEPTIVHGLMTFLAHPGVPPDQGGSSPADELGMGIHGGTDETSIMLHLAPGLVDMTATTRNVPEALAANRYVRFGGSVGFGWLSNDFGPDGQLYVTLATDAAAAERIVFASSYGDIWLAVEPADADESGTSVQNADRIFG